MTLTEYADYVPKQHQGFCLGMETDRDKCFLSGYDANCAVPLKLHNSPEERSSPLLCGGNLKSPMGQIVFSVR